MAKTLNQLRQRVKAMRSVLFWEDEIRNQRVRTIFGLEPVQASRLLRALREEPDLKLSEDQGVYRLVGAEEPTPAIGDYLGFLSISGETLDWLEDARIDFLDPDRTTFARIRSACIKRHGLCVLYCSMTHPLGQKRTIFPHTVVRLASRWHVRAWCEKSSEFRDFNIGRFREIEEISDAAPKQRDDDAAWNERVDIRIAPHPGLTREQVNVIRAEYFPGASARKISCRGALAPYVIHALRAAIDLEREAPPDYQLHVTNAQSLREHLFPPSRKGADPRRK